MSLKKTVLAAGLGVVAGFFIKKQMDNCQKVTPENALQTAKEAFKQQGPISGSWIYMKPEEVERNGLLYTAYRGGITRNINRQNIQYEFYTDAKTGTIIDTSQTA